ncbi:ADP-ribosylation factor-like protein 6-interacting protein 6 [Atheta coriaria]|uniref:ADP-ribosylation factor-like protein 6-interacting protein 6 n=1 Tax=Dalotia coriaria TaxID=877792 RepID=UPI0031F3C52B
MSSPPRVFLTEKRWALYGIAVSCSVIVAKLLHTYGNTLWHQVIETKLTQVDQLADDGQLMFKHVYRNSVKYSSYWLPVVCGLLTTYLTWVTVYLDSDVPGVHPPSPLSPQKFKKASGHAFHLSYIFALLIGGMVTYYMYASGMHIEFST